MKTLKDIRVGDTVSVKKLHGEGAVKRRIMDMIITPPDVVSQIMIALPMLLLYQLSIWLCRVFRKRKIDRDEDEDEEGTKTSKQA